MLCIVLTVLEDVPILSVCFVCIRLVSCSCGGGGGREGDGLLWWICLIDYIIALQSSGSMSIWFSQQHPSPPKGSIVELFFPMAELLGGDFEN